MNAHSKLSSKGQLVVPKAVRDRLGWQPADIIEYVELPDGVTLRAVQRTEAGLSVAEAMEALRRIANYQEPPISDEQIREAGTAGAAESYLRSCDR